MPDKVPVILIIDDNPTNLGILFELLDARGFEILTATTGESGLKRAEHVQPDLILLDVMMPGIDGFETCRRLKAQEATRQIPVIFMTALNDTKHKVTGFDAGAVDYVTKPIQAKEVLARIHTHLTMHRLQNELQTRNQELTAALERERELNTLKSRFISLASHELRTPLSTIHVSADLLQRYGGRMPEEKRGHELSLIKATVKRMTGLLDEVLTAAKAGAGGFECHPERIDVRDCCQRIIDQFAGVSAHTHTLVFSAQGDDFRAMLDPRLLEQILSNLLSNAIKYSPDGGKILIVLERQPERLTLRVADEGIGISEADQQRLFAPFHRGDNVGAIQGTGLGLSIVKQFVELQRGTIQVTSQPGQGTTVEIRFPCEHKGADLTGIHEHKHL